MRHLLRIEEGDGRCCVRRSQGRLAGIGGSEGALRLHLRHKSKEAMRLRELDACPKLSDGLGKSLPLAEHFADPLIAYGCHKGVRALASRSRGGAQLREARSGGLLRPRRLQI